MSDRPDQVKEPFTVKGSTMLITGGSSGIGFSLAKQFKEAGASVIITARSKDTLEKASKELGSVPWYTCDVSKPEERIKLRDQVLKEHPDLDIIVNNAGTQRRVGLAEEEEDWSKRALEIQLNIEAPIHFAWLFTPHLKTKKSAAIINVTSSLAFIPCVFCPTYGATKAAMHSWTLSARYHYQQTHIRLVEIVPPSVKTSLGGAPGSNVHDWGADPESFSKAVFERLKAGELEIGYNESDEWRTNNKEEALQQGHKAASMYKGPLY